MRAISCLVALGACVVSYGAELSHSLRESVRTTVSGCEVKKSTLTILNQLNIDLKLLAGYITYGKITVKDETWEHDTGSVPFSRPSEDLTIIPSGNLIDVSFESNGNGCLGVDGVLTLVPYGNVKITTPGASASFVSAWNQYNATQYSAMTGINGLTIGIKDSGGNAGAKDTTFPVQYSQGNINANVQDASYDGTYWTCGPLWAYSSTSAYCGQTQICYSETQYWPANRYCPVQASKDQLRFTPGSYFASPVKDNNRAVTATLGLTINAEGFTQYPVFDNFVSSWVPVVTGSTVTLSESVSFTQSTSTASAQAFSNSQAIQSSQKFAVEGFGEASMTETETNTVTVTTTKTITNTESTSYTSSCTSYPCSNGRLYQWQTTSHGTFYDGSITVGTVTSCDFQCVEAQIPNGPLCPLFTCGDAYCQCCNQVWSTSSNISVNMLCST